MLQRFLKMHRYLVLIAVISTFIAASALIIYEAIVLGRVLIDIVGRDALAFKSSKALAIGLIEVVDVFLIAIAMYIISLSLYKLFVDDTIVLPAWLKVRDLEDLKANLVSVAIAVLAVLFLREAVSWEGERDILAFGAALALVILALSVYLDKKAGRRE